MKRWMLFFILCVLSWSQLFAQTAEERAFSEKRYGIQFYGVALPETGARILLVIDRSKSMGRKDSARSDGGRRWDTLLDEVRTMTGQMAEVMTRKRSHFSIALLYEGGTPDSGSELYTLTQPDAITNLLANLEGQTFGAGGCFEETFGQNLWPLVARHHMTHLFYLGDNDIASHADPVRTALSAWYRLPRKNPVPAQRKLYALKCKWWEPWEHWRAPQHNRPVFKKQQDYPPPPKDVILSCIAIGQASPFLKELATLGHGEYVERLAPSKKRTRKLPPE
ncbi:MAG: VWA domain-containing protein [Kiritimatiellia bacterium]